MPGATRGPRVRVAIALGSNLGRRRQHLSWAAAALRRLGRGWRISPFEPSAPQGVPDRQPDYLNGVAVGYTRLPARELLGELLALETRRGRTRGRPKAARTLDLDLILYDGRVVDEPGLQLPHPRFRERAFVLEPLAALAPRWRDPVSGRTVAALRRELHAREAARGSRKTTRRPTR